MIRKTTKWIVDTSILNQRNVIGNIPEAIKKVGRDIFITDYRPLDEYQDYGLPAFDFDRNYCDFSRDRPYSLYGSIGYVQKCKYRIFPGAFGINDNTNCNVYYSQLPSEWMLNANFVMAPFKVIENDPSRFFDLFDTDDLFIRPNSGRKTFTGYTITRENAAFELRSSMALTSVMPETICLISPAINIKAEFRFVVGNNEVIDGSEYRWDNILDIRHDWLEDCHKLATKMAKHSWQPDLCYTVDVADTEDGPKIVELNGFSCAGLYATDKELVFGRVSEISEKMFYGDI